MTSSKSAALLCGVATAALITASAAMAHDPTGKGGIPAAIAKRMIEGNKSLAKLDDSSASRGLYSQLKQWTPAYAKLRVCFMGGNNASNAKVAAIARKWSDDSGMGLKLDFGNAKKPRMCDAKGRESQIRVSYNQPGNWSTVGQDGVVFVAQEEANLNLEAMDTVDPAQLDTSDLHGTILHEFGHALGLFHEHQSPMSNCGNEFNWDYLVNTLGGPPNSWDKETISHNLGTYEPDQRLLATPFDPNSIMIYSFPPEYYLNGEKATCFVPSSRDALSPLDRVTINYMYSSDAAARASNFGQVQSKFMALWDKARETGATKSVGLDFPKAFFGAKGVAADEE